MQAALQYLKWKKIAPKKKVRPTEPGGSGKDWFEYDYLNPEESEVSPSEFWESQEANRQKSDRANGGFSERYQDNLNKQTSETRAGSVMDPSKFRGWSQIKKHCVPVPFKTQLNFGED
eukprot:4873412-Amphidinium_carterae.1